MGWRVGHWIKAKRSLEQTRRPCCSPSGRRMIRYRDNRQGSNFGSQCTSAFSFPATTVGHRNPGLAFLSADPPAWALRSASRSRPFAVKAGDRNLVGARPPSLPCPRPARRPSAGVTAAAAGLARCVFPCDCWGSWAGRVPGRVPGWARRGAAWSRALPNGDLEGAAVGGFISAGVQ